MVETWLVELQREMQGRKEVLQQRLDRIRDNHMRALEPDSKERAMQLENQEVVDALGNEARVELRQLSTALKKIEDGTFGNCGECGEPIGRNRLLACPEAEKCIDCAELDDDARRHAG